MKAQSYIEAVQEIEDQILIFEGLIGALTLLGKPSDIHQKELAKLFIERELLELSLLN